MVDFTIDTTAFEALARDLEALPAALERELRDANQRIGAKVNAEARKLISEKIYGIPIPLKASANRTFDRDTVPEPLRPFVAYGDTVGPAVVRVRFRKALSDATKEKIFNTNQQTHRGQVVRQWRRTGNLLNRERYVLATHGKGSYAVILINDADYAAARNALGGPSRLNKAGRRAGSQRNQEKRDERERSNTVSIQWQEEAVKLNVDWIREQYRLALTRAAGARS